MNKNRFRRPVVVLFIVAVITKAGYVSRAVWMPWFHKNAAEEVHSEQAAGPTEKVIVGDQAQKNLRISSKALKVEDFWKTITLPGMIVDRPGISDREVVAPS